MRRLRFPFLFNKLRYLKTEHLRKLGQAEPLPALPDFSLVLCTKAALHSAALGQLLHLHAHPRKHVLAHIDCSKPSEHMHAQTPTQSSYEPSHLMFMHQPQSGLSKPPCGFLQNLSSVYVGSKYANSFLIHYSNG